MAAVNILFVMIFGRIELILSVSEAKFDAEADFEVRLAVARQKPRLFGEKRNFSSKLFADFFFRRRKMKRWESSETRFPEFSWRTDVISRGKRTFELSLEKFSNLQNGLVFLGAMYSERPLLLLMKAALQPPDTVHCDV